MLLLILGVLGATPLTDWSFYQTVVGTSGSCNYTGTDTGSTLVIQGDGYVCSAAFCRLYQIDVSKPLLRITYDFVAQSSTSASMVTNTEVQVFSARNSSGESIPPMNYDLTLPLSYIGGSGSMKTSRYLVGWKRYGGGYTYLSGTQEYSVSTAASASSRNYGYVWVCVGLTDLWSTNYSQRVTIYKDTISVEEVDGEVEWPTAYNLTSDDTNYYMDANYVAHPCKYESSQKCRSWWFVQESGSSYSILSAGALDPYFYGPVHLTAPKDWNEDTLLLVGEWGVYSSTPYQEYRQQYSVTPLDQITPLSGDVVGVLNLDDDEDNEYWSDTDGDGEAEVYDDPGDNVVTETDNQDYDGDPTIEYGTDLNGDGTLDGYYDPDDGRFYYFSGTVVESKVPATDGSWVVQLMLISFVTGLVFIIVGIKSS